MAYFDTGVRLSVLKFILFVKISRFTSMVTSFGTGFLSKFYSSQRIFFLFTILKAFY